ncbi:MAG: Flp pilus assembly protein CpaB [Burkholderiales bacterium]|nr:Flp pilus assembly protein CpaB [Phycisphaerae bacterium]
MNWKAWIPLAVAIVLGLLAARMAMNFVGAKSSEEASSTTMTSILVAAHDIEPGTPLTDTDLKLAKVDAASVPAGSFSSAAGVTSRVTKIALTTNQAILPTLLADDGAGWGAGATLPKGMRAVTVAIDDVTGVAGFIQPTCRVDVVATIQTDGKAISKTVLEGIMVFAVGSRTGPAVAPVPGQPPEPPARTLTLLATPEQAEKLDLATTSGRVRLVLRNGKDGTKTTSDGMTIAELKGASDTDIFAPADAVQTSHTMAIPTTNDGAPANPLWTIEVIRGGQSSTQTFDLNKKQAIPLAPNPLAPGENPLQTPAPKSQVETQIGSTTETGQH